MSPPASCTNVAGTGAVALANLSYTTRPCTASGLWAGIRTESGNELKP
jgi:hypothetical protein